MIDLSTTYLGLPLRTPLVASASPLSQELDGIRHLEDAGASAVVLYSLFEEQLRQEIWELDHHLTEGTDSFAEAMSLFPAAIRIPRGTRRISESHPSRQGSRRNPYYRQPQRHHRGRLDPVRQTNRAGRRRRARMQHLFHPYRSRVNFSRESSKQYLDIVKTVKSAVTIPVAVKLSPFFSNMANLAKRLDQAGANALVLFNRFYQPDINLDELEIQPNVLLSTPQALRLPLTWIGILYGRIQANLAATSGVHGPEDVVKLLMVGADVTMLCSTLLRNGIEPSAIHRRWLTAVDGKT